MSQRNDREFKLPPGYTWRTDEHGSIVRIYAHMLMFGQGQSFIAGPEEDTELCLSYGNPEFLVFANTAWGLTPLPNAVFNFPDGHPATLPDGLRVMVVMGFWVEGMNFTAIPANEAFIDDGLDAKTKIVTWKGGKFVLYNHMVWGLEPIPAT